MPRFFCIIAQSLSLSVFRQQHRSTLFGFHIVCSTPASHGQHPLHFPRRDWGYMTRPLPTWPSIPHSFETGIGVSDPFLASTDSSIACDCIYLDAAPCHDAQNIKRTRPLTTLTASTLCGFQRLTFPSLFMSLYCQQSHNMSCWCHTRSLSPLRFLPLSLAFPPLPLSLSPYSSVSKLYTPHTHTLSPSLLTTPSHAFLVLSCMLH